MTPKEKSEQAQRLLAAYVREIKHFKTTWGIAPDKQVHLNAWAKAKRENCLPNRRVPAALTVDRPDVVLFVNS